MISITLLLACFGMVGCSVEKENVNTSGFKEVLEKISVPDMSTAILSSSKAEQLEWLSDVYDFEVNTMQSKTSGLLEADLQAVKAHLSQVFGAEEVELLIEGFYQYDQNKKSYYVPDGHWFGYNEQWPSSSLTITEQSEKSVTLKLTGVDDYGGDNREIHYFLSINNDHMLVEKRTLIK